MGARLSPRLPDEVTVILEACDNCDFNLDAPKEAEPSRHLHWWEPEDRLRRPPIL